MDQCIAINIRACKYRHIIWSLIIHLLTEIQLHWFRLIIYLLRVLQSIEFQTYEQLYLDIIDVIEKLCCYYYTFFEYIIISFIRSTKLNRLRKFLLILWLYMSMHFTFRLNEILEDPKNKTFGKVDFNYSITVLMDGL